MSKTSEGWDIDDDGRMPFCPLTDFKTALYAKNVCLLRIEFARNQDQLDGIREAIQLVMGPEEAVRLGMTLVEMGTAAKPSHPKQVS